MDSYGTADETTGRDDAKRPWGLFILLTAAFGVVGLIALVQGTVEKSDMSVTLVEVKEPEGITEGIPINTDSNEASIYFTYCSKAFDSCRGHGVEHHSGEHLCPDSQRQGINGCQTCINSYVRDFCGVGGNKACHKDTIANHGKSCFFAVLQCEQNRLCYNTENTWNDVKSCRDCMFEKYIDNYENYASHGKLLPGETALH